jgi:ribonuclease BN (tRNA processing enzyme)
MQIEFLGTGGYHPNERRHTACVMLPEIGLVFDAGTAFFRVPERLQTSELTVFLSHAHLDHIAGLTFPLVPMVNGKLRTLRVYGTSTTLTAVRQHLFADPLFPVQPNFEYIELDGDVILPDGGVLRHTPLNHPGGSNGFRIDWPERSLAYITDTTAGPDGVDADFIRGVDLLIHECNFADDMREWALKTGHSHLTPVLELARDAEVGRLILLHIDPECPGDDPIGLNGAQNIFPGTVVAEDGDLFEF